jgi:hypothetical protein
VDVWRGLMLAFDAHGLRLDLRTLNSVRGLSRIPAAYQVRHGRRFQDGAHTLRLTEVRLPAFAYTPGRTYAWAPARDPPGILVLFSWPRAVRSSSWAISGRRGRWAPSCTKPPALSSPTPPIPQIEIPSRKLISGSRSSHVLPEDDGSGVFQYGVVATNHSAGAAFALPFGMLKSCTPLMRSVPSVIHSR